MDADIRKFILPGWLWIAIFSLSVLGQISTTPAPQSSRAISDNPVEDKVQTLRLNSKLMSREMPYRVILPPGYSALKFKEPGYSVIYLLHGLTGHFDNWTDRTKLAEYSATHKFIIVTPEGDNGWYTDSSTISNDKYESYIIKELIPEIDKTFRTIPDRDHRAIAGLSMGGYGGLKFGLKYPEMFSLAGSFSGALKAASYSEKTIGPRGKTVDAILGAENSETRNANDIFKMIREISSEKIKSLPFLYIDCGTEDFLFDSNREFVTLLVEKKVRHEYRQLPGAHNWIYWNAQVKEFLEVAGSRLKKWGIEERGEPPFLTCQGCRLNGRFLLDYIFEQAEKN
ncbi:MAG: esterase family protein [Acidobacteriota bacterium]|nr:esterase family protein [Acidobacteriota bacterium]